MRSPQSPNEAHPDYQQPHQISTSRKSSINIESSIFTRRQSTNESGESQSTTDMFKEMLSQKRNMLLNKLTSFDSDVSIDLTIVNSYTTISLETKIKFQFEIQTCFL